ncbi:MAG: hypothetical protein ACP6IS_11570 [Candidatus Asgardarchaeia archaeon]
MEKMKTIKIRAETYEKLNELAGILQSKLKRPVSLDETIQYLLRLSRKTKITSFAGTWKMSDEEEEEIMISLKRLWSSWKM